MTRDARGTTRLYRVPRSSSTLVGREAEVAELCRRLRNATIRLITLTGPPGVGKTRLSLAAADAVTPELELGALFVNLAPLRDPDLLEHLVVQRLGLGYQRLSHLPPLERIADRLASRRLLLVLDNFEQIAAAAPRVSALLAACPNLVVLATSRQPLRLSGEHEFPVSPLAGPDPSRLSDLSAVVASPAVALFVERARAIQPGFALTEQHGRAVAEICARLDGLPLAIELAAARIRAFPPAGILARLNPRLPFLTAGARDLPQRQQTVEAAIAWSEELLDAGERALFRRLSVFVGGFTLDAAQAVAADGAPCEDSVLSLLEKNLLHRVEEDGQEPRFGMLETIREYAAERLASDQEHDRIHDRHMSYYLEWTERVKAQLDDGRADVLNTVVAGEYDNLRAALVRAFEHADMGAAIRVANVLCRFWNRRGNVGEAYRWLESIVERSHDVPASMRASVLGSAATTARRYGDWARSAAHAQESLDLARRAGHPRAIALALLEVGHALDPLRRPGDAMQRYLEALDVASRANDQGRIAAGLQGVALASCGQGELAKAARLLGAAEVLFEATGIEYAPTSVAEQTVMGRTIVTLLTGLGREAFGQAWAEGRRMPRSQAVDYALGRTALPDMPVAPVPTAGQPQDQNPLTPREREVAALIAQGFSNREIAAKLVVSERTVDAHLQHILNKLGFHSRAQVAAWVAVAR